MATKIKGFCKGFKFISHLFVVKEREMEIGYPTDVKHVAHIGWDAPDDSGPSWMSGFKTSGDFSVASVGRMGGSRDPTSSSQDFDLSMAKHPSSDIFNSFPLTNPPSLPKKQKRKKAKSASSPKKSCSSPKSNPSRVSSLMSRTSVLHGRDRNSCLEMQC